MGCCISRLIFSNCIIIIAHRSCPLITPYAEQIETFLGHPWQADHPLFRTRDLIWWLKLLNLRTSFDRFASGEVVVPPRTSLLKCLAVTLIIRMRDIACIVQKAGTTYPFIIDRLIKTHRLLGHSSAEFKELRELFNFHFADEAPKSENDYRCRAWEKEVFFTQNVYTDVGTPRMHFG